MEGARFVSVAVGPNVIKKMINYKTNGGDSYVRNTKNSEQIKYVTVNVYKAIYVIGF